MINSILTKLNNVSMTKGRFFSDKSYKYDTLFFATKYLYAYINNDRIVINQNIQEQIVEKIVKAFTLPEDQTDSNRNYLLETLGFLCYTGALKKESQGNYIVSDMSQLDFITVSIENAYIYQYLVAYKTFVNDGLWDLYKSYLNCNVKSIKENILQDIKAKMCSLSQSIGDPNTVWASNMVKFPIMVLGLANADNVVSRTLAVKDNIIVPKDLSANVEGTKSTSAKDNFYLHDFRINYVKDFLKDIDNPNISNDSDYKKFKCLIEWFVKQLNINNDLEQGTKTSGQGYKDGSAIRKLYNEWRDYGEFTLDCNIISGFQSSFSKVNYINRTGTGINVRPNFDNETKEIKNLFIDVYGNDKEVTSEISSILEKEYEISTLSLFDNQEPNSKINELFDDYKKVMDYYLSNEKNQELLNRSPREIKIHPLNAILYGAPGTGKTYATAEYAVAIIENRDIKDEDREELMKRYRELQKEGKITFTTFHQSYGYEDFIQGLRPETKDGVMEFKPVDGVFKRIADKALNDNNSNYVIIIDEINRANMSKVLGELITLIEEDKRWGEINELSVTLPSGEVFVVPNNLYIIGTMNTADKSISIIDVALRRRFEFIEQQVDPSKVADTKLRDVLNKINSKLKDETDSTDLLVGHAYFMNKTIEDLDKLLNRAIIPLLYEYFFDNGKKVKSVVEEAISGTGYKVDSSTLGRIKVVKE